MHAGVVPAFVLVVIHSCAGEYGLHFRSEVGIKEECKRQAITPGQDSFLRRFNRAKEKVNQSIEQAAEEVAIEEAAQTRPNVDPSTLPESRPTEPVPVQVTDSDSAPVELLKTAEPAIHVIGVGAIVTVLVIFMLLERRSLHERVIVLAGQNRLNITTVLNRR